LKINNTRQGVIILENKEVEDVNSFTYLGSVIATDGGTEQDVKVAIGKEEQLFASSDLFGDQRRYT